MANDGKGWFSATRSNCSWALSSTTPGDGAASSVKVTPSATGECTLTSASHSLVASHKYYLSFKVRFESQTSDTFDWYWPVAEPSAMNHASASGDASTWLRVSALFTRTSFSDGNYTCRWDYNNDSGNNIPVWFTSCMLFDLTAAFGAGNEPDKAWMDENVTSFGDSITVQYPERMVFSPPDGWREESGAHVSFKSPSDSKSAEALRIGSNVYSIIDAYGNSLVGKNGTFISGAILDFILDCENKKAYLQNSAAADYIVEQGTSNGWTYRKWNSGIAECWRDLSVSTACSTAVGSWYRTAALATTAYPFTFKEAPNLQMTFETFAGTSGLVWSAGTSDSTPQTQPADIYIIRMTSATSITGKVHYYAIGKWK